MSPVEIIARAICRKLFEGVMRHDVIDDAVDKGWVGHRKEATTVLLALSQMEPTPGMVEAGINAAEVDHNDLDLAMANAFRAMLAAALAEGDGV